MGEVFLLEEPHARREVGTAPPSRRRMVGWCPHPTISYGGTVNPFPTDRRPVVRSLLHPLVDPMTWNTVSYSMLDLPIGITAFTALASMTVKVVRESSSLVRVSQATGSS